MELNNKNSEPQFKYSYNGNKTKVFPIDYTLEEFSARSNVDQRTLQRTVLRSPLFQTTLLQLLKSGKETKKKGKDLEPSWADKYPLPLESQLFLEELTNLAKNNETYRQILLQKAWRSPKNEQKFMDQLFSELKSIISDESSTDEIVFYQHVLLNDETFEEFILNDLWKTQLDFRIKRLKECAREAPLDIQAQALSTCFHAIDTAAFHLTFYKKTSSQKTYQQCLKGLLQDLLSARKQLKETADSKQSYYATYLVDNIAVDVDNMNMEQAFSMLEQQKGSKDLLEKARDAYWKHIAKNRENSLFEEGYIPLQKYLDDSAAIISRSDLRQLVKTICKENLSNILGIKLFIASPKLSNNKYLYKFVRNVVETYQNNLIYIFRDTFRLFFATPQFLQELKQLEQISSFADFSADLKRALEGYESFFRRAWQFFCNHGMLDSKDGSPFDNVSASAKALTMGINNSLKFFDMMHFQCAEEAVQHMLEIHVESRTHISLENTYNCLSQCDQPLFTDMLLMLLHQISKDSEEKLLQILPKFITIQEDEEEGSLS